MNRIFLNYKCQRIFHSKKHCTDFHQENGNRIKAIYAVIDWGDESKIEERRRKEEREVNAFIKWANDERNIEKNAIAVIDISSHSAFTHQIVLPEIKIHDHIPENVEPYNPFEQAEKVIETLLVLNLSDNEEIEKFCNQYGPLETDCPITGHFQLVRTKVFCQPLTHFIRCAETIKSAVTALRRKPFRRSYFKLVAEHINAILQGDDVRAPIISRYPGVWTVMGFNDYSDLPIRTYYFTSLRQALGIYLLHELEERVSKYVPKDKECPVCGGEFTPTRRGHKYCSPQCRWDFNNNQH